MHQALVALAVWVQVSQVLVVVVAVVADHLFVGEGLPVWFLDPVVPDLVWGPDALVVLGQEDVGLLLALGLVVPELVWVLDQGVLVLALLPVQEGPDSVSGVLPAVVPSDLALAVGLSLVASLPAWTQKLQASLPPLHPQTVQIWEC